MLTIKVRIYRSHDFDLMVLAQAGVISIAPVAKKVIESYFLGQDYHIQVTNEPQMIPTRIPNVLATRIQITDAECPGIEAWFRGFTEGFRNNLIKCLIRRAIVNIPFWVYRTDGWESAEAALQEEREVDAMLAEIDGTSVKKSNSQSEFGGTGNALELHKANRRENFALDREKSTAHAGYKPNMPDPVKDSKMEPVKDRSEVVTQPPVIPARETAHIHQEAEKSQINRNPTAIQTSAEEPKVPKEPKKNKKQEIPSSVNESKIEKELPDRPMVGQLPEALPDEEPDDEEVFDAFGALNAMQSGL